MLRRAAQAVLISVAVAATFAPVLGFALLNWDDHLVIVDNANLARPGVLRWAFTTFYMEHYQPKSWLLWASFIAAGPPDPRVFHALNLVLHIIVCLFVWLVARDLSRDLSRGQSPSPSVTAKVAETAATAAALVYGLHPLRVEVVAWVSAMPYTLATLLALTSVWWWLRDGVRGPQTSWVGLGLFAASLLARPVAVGLPAVLVVLDVWRMNRPWLQSVRRAVPYGALAVLAAGVEFVARAPGLADVPWSFRVQSALAAPFVYVWRTLVPQHLTPLDVLPLEPVGDPLVTGLALAGFVAVTAAGWRLRRMAPGGLATWTIYLALLFPAGGLVPSGLQATADRYTYLPGIALAVAACGAVASWTSRSPLARAGAALAAVMAVAACAAASRTMLPVWHDSISLWTRVVEVDPRNDMGLYNLGTALAEAGQTDAAADRYRAAVAMNPAHAAARTSLDRIDAARLEREANQLASAGRLQEAVVRYQEALTRDAQRPRAHAGRGMALASLGRTDDALAHLREAVALGVDDAAVFNTLAGLLVETGRTGEARAVLEGALQHHPEDVGLAHNLARLLVSTPDLPPQDRMRAFRLAEAVAQSTGGNDPRALDTLAASLAGIGRMADARAFSARAAAAAAAQGDQELAVQITARGRAYR